MFAPIQRLNYAHVCQITACYLGLSLNQKSAFYILAAILFYILAETMWLQNPTETLVGSNWVINNGN